MPIASRNIPSVAPVDIDGINGTPGKYFSTSFSAGPKMAGSSGGGTAIGRIGATGVILTPGSAIAATRAACVPSTDSPGKMRQLTFAVARCGNALLARRQTNK